MTYHKKAFPRQEALTQALKDHGLEHSTPSQLADAFRLGWQAMHNTLSEIDEAANRLLKAYDTRYTFLEGIDDEVIALRNALRSGASAQTAEGGADHG